MSNWDVAIVGGGASGLFCAGKAAENGLKVLVVEGRERPARKLLITGKGRCNVTNDCDFDAFFQNVVTNPKFLFGAIRSFSPQDTMSFFESLRVPLKVERGNRVFPVSDRAMDIVDALLAWIKTNGVIIQHARVKSLLFSDSNHSACGVILDNDSRVLADNVVLATGGLSYPATGSDGYGYKLAQSAGHQIIKPRPSLIGLDCIDDNQMFSALAGLAPKNVHFYLFDKNNHLVYDELGEMLFTHTGVSGPLVLTASTYLKDKANTYHAFIDFKPGLDLNMLDQRILRDFSVSVNKEIGNALNALLPKSIIPWVLKISGISSNAVVNQITKLQRQSLTNTIKHFPLSISKTGPIEEAIITSGGVDVKEVNPKTMESKICPHLFIIGELLDVDAKTGGFNLQIAWSTANSAANSIKRSSL